MGLRAEELRERAAAWAREDDDVLAGLVYGSVADGTANADSDLDLIVVARPGRRAALWQRREQIGAALLGGPAAWSHELPWQRPYRYQAYDPHLTAVDMTIDEERVAPWPALAKGFIVLADKGDVAASLRAELADWHQPEFDAAAFNGNTWAWLNYLHGRLGHGETWIVRYGVADTLQHRVIPLLGAAGHSAHRQLAAADLDRVQRAAPASAEPIELRRSLLATAQAYAWALDRWSERTGQPRPEHPLAAAILDKLAGNDARRARDEGSSQ
jgi:hypothetical protein